MSRSLIYITYNGVYTHTTGIGTQTQMLLQAFERYASAIRIRYGSVALHLLSPTITVPGYTLSPHTLAYATDIARSTGGSVSAVPFGPYRFWTVASWRRLSLNSSLSALQIVGRYNDSIAIAVDTPLLQVGVHCGRRRQRDKRLHIIQAIYGTSYIHDRGQLSTNRLRWERRGIDATRRFPNVFLGHVCKTLHDHLIDRYGASPRRFVPLRAAILTDHADNSALPEAQRDSIIREFAIPLDRPVVLAFGRADPIKGFETLIASLAPLKDIIHLVLIAVPYSHGDPIVRRYERLIARYSIRASLISTFTRLLPRALCQHPHTRVVVCPSLGEPFSNIPLEVSLWARHAGPILLCSALDGFLEQISPGINGYLFDPSNKTDLSDKLAFILRLPPNLARQIRRAAADRIETSYSYRDSLFATLDRFWS